MTSTTEVPMRFADAPLLLVIDDVLTARECRAEVARIEAASPRLATDNPIYRDQDRVIRNDVAFVQDLYARIESRLPQKLGALRCVRLNERLRCYRYRPGHASRRTPTTGTNRMSARSR